MIGNFSVRVNHLAMLKMIHLVRRGQDLPCLKALHLGYLRPFKLTRIADVFPASVNTPR